MRQRSLHRILKFAAVSLCFSAVVENVPAQSATGTPALEPVVLNKLFPPVYPPLARQARITGDVKMQVTIRQDGSVASAEVISGHPMLKQAAVDSVQKSTFECQRWSSGVYVVGCRDAVTSFTLTYTFGMRDDPGDLDCRVTRPRSRRCLYLWRCGLWHSKDQRPPAVGDSSDHVMILADPACVETETAARREPDPSAAAATTPKTGHR
jgi:TonB family protein